MPSSNAHLHALSEGERLQLEAWLVELDLSWNEGRLAERAGALPARGPLREAALIEMVKIDLERQWQRGKRRSIEDYLHDFPELGGPETVSPDLLLTENEVRRQFGEAQPLSALAQRFPHRAEAVRSLVAQTIPPAQGTWGTGETVSGQGQDAALPDRFGRYQVLRCLGRGGMGVVYLAHDTRLDRRVALKVPQAIAGDDTLRERFQREARAAAQLNHPNVCPIYDVGQVDGAPYLTMAYLEGPSLAQLLDSGPPFVPRQAAELIRTCAGALAEAHRCGIIHRDLKPANIMLGPRGEPVIMDFGLARWLAPRGAQLTRTGMLVGTPAYMAPEQVRGGAVGPACDVYALGAILYELLAGRPPFVGGLAEVLAQALTATPAPPSAHRAGCDASLEAICLKALAREVADRYGTMDELGAALARYLQGAPIALRPRFRWAWVLLGAGTVGVVIAIALALRPPRGGGGGGAPKKPAEKAVVREEPPPAAIQALIDELASPDDRVRLSAAERLRKHRHPASVRALCATLRDPHSAVRRVAAEGLRKLADVEAVPALMQVVASEDWLVQKWEKLPGDKYARWMADPSASGKSAALSALREMAPARAPEALRTALRAKNALVRGWAARELAADREPEVVQALVQALSDEAGYVRRSAADSLGKLDAREAISALARRIADDAWVKPYFGSDDGSWAHRKLTDPEAGGKAAALRALQHLAPDEVGPALKNAQRSRHPEVRAWAAAELARLSGLN